MTKEEQQEIRLGGADVVRRLLSSLVAPNRLPLERIDPPVMPRHHWYLLLDGEKVCYVGYARKGNNLVSFRVEGSGHRSYPSFDEAEGDAEFKEELCARVRKILSGRSV